MTLWIKKHARNRSHYHTDATCHDLNEAEDTREVAQEIVDQMGLDKCKRCANDVDRSTVDWSHYQALREVANE